MTHKRRFIVIGEYPEGMDPEERDDFKVLSIDDSEKDSDANMDDLEKKGFRDLKKMTVV